MKFRLALTLTTFLAGFAIIANTTTSLAAISKIGGLGLMTVLALFFLGLAVLQRRKALFSVSWG
jgi:hypothetical protein